MSKKLTRGERILRILQYKAGPEGMSCQQITKYIIVEEKLKDNKALYASGSVSSKLAKMVKKGTLKYSDQKTDRGGHIYQLNNK